MTEANETADQKQAEDADITEPKAKKPKLFSGKEFRKQLRGEERMRVLLNFSKEIKNNEKPDCILDYLDSGGSCLELLQIIESDSTVPPSIIFEIVYYSLLRIHSKYPQHQSSGYEACKYMLNTYLTLFNKMMSLNSSPIERKTALNLLTAAATFSSNLAKDILLQINFNPTNIELLSKRTGTKDTVREAFINFLMAFLVDGYYPTLAVLLEKRGLLTSIIKDLQYDNADCVCLVMTALKNHVLENQFVSKTVKMHTFSTPVVKDIVNLYNWKGPQVDKKKSSITKVDEYEKSKVSEAVHQFLLVLCTSHKHGVIFKDRTLGMGKKHQNSLMYTVLEGLEKPWMHSYACELVTKTCKACPELSRGMWSNVKAYLEPRTTKTWLNTIRFARQLIIELEPNCIEYCFSDMNANQLAQTVQFLVSPTPILKTVIPETKTFESHSTKYFILQLLLESLKQIHAYIGQSEKCLTPEKYNTLKRLLSEHIFRNFPSALDILTNWDVTENEIPQDFETFTLPEYLKCSFEVMEYYKKICPLLLETLSNTFDLQNFLNQILEISADETDQSNIKLLFVKAIHIIMDIDSTVFLPNKDIFQYSFPLLLEFYHQSKDSAAREALLDVLKNSSIFESCESEISLWIDGILNVKKFDPKLAEFIIDILKTTYLNNSEYLEKIVEFNVSNDVEIQHNVDDLLQNLIESSGDKTSTTNNIIRHTSFSALVVGLLENGTEYMASKAVKNYVQFVLIGLLHLQTNPDAFTSIISSTKYSEIIPENILKYINDWNQNVEPLEITKFKGQLNIIQDFSTFFLQGNIQTFLEENKNELDTYVDLKLNLLQMCVFYFTNLVKFNTVTEGYLQNCKHYVNFLGKHDNFRNCYIKTILGHPALLQNFSPLQIDKNSGKDISTKFVVDCIQEFEKLSSESILQVFLQPYRSKLLHSVLKAIKKSFKEKYQNKYGSLIQIIETLNLEYEQCVDALNAITNLLENKNIDQENTIYSILMYSLKRFVKLSKEQKESSPLENNVMNILTKYLSELNKSKSNTSEFSEILLAYLEAFPNSTKQVNDQLFESILLKNEFCKNGSALATFLLEQNFNDLSATLKANIENICDKKGLLLPLLEVAVANKFDSLELIYNHFTHSIVKALQKPQKAGQHFEKHYKAVAFLLEQYLPESECMKYLEKIHKYDASETFHAYLLKTIFLKALLTKPDEEKSLEKHVSNCILTFAHLSLHVFKKKTKTEEDWTKLGEITKIFIDFTKKASENLKISEFSFTQVVQNESFQLFCKFCLKFGLSGQSYLIKIFSLLSAFLKYTEEDVGLILEMIVSHSEFLDLILNDESVCKTELLYLILVLCEKFPSVLQRNHVPVLLAAYRATLTPSDRCVLKLLKMCEKNASQTCFFDFKPFLFGRSAAAHYSVRSDIQNALWRQPKTGDVLNILQESTVRTTIKNYPTELTLNSSEININLNNEKDLRITYDLTFLLALFDQLLAPENAVQTYRFTRSGAIALTIMGLSSYDEEVRKASCHVLARFYHHLEARQTGKDNLLWLRFIEAICKGTAVLEDFTLNNFAAIFFARASLVLTQPGHTMYIGLSRYLAAKSTLDFSGIPELYTFLHSPEVNFKEHRNFILEILRDGMKTKKDFQAALHSMAFKLIMELYNSSISDLETRVLILEVFRNACSISLGVKILCGSYGFLSWLLFVSRTVDSDCANVVVPVIKDIVGNIVKVNSDGKTVVDLNIVDLISKHFENL